MVRVLKHLVAALFVIFFAACSGGGCSSGCAGCGGFAPLATEFPTGKRIENAATLRLTDSGIGFIESNLGRLAPKLLGTSGGQAGVFTFAIPETTTSGTGYSAKICPGGGDLNASPPKCVVEVDLVGSTFDLKGSNPHDVMIDGMLRVRLQNLPLEVKIGFGPLSTTVHANVTASGGKDECPGSGNISFAGIPLHKEAGKPGIDISIETDLDAAHDTRFGYSKANIKSVDFDQNTLVDAVHFCPKNTGSDVLNEVKGLIGSSLVGGLTGSLSGMLSDALCQKPSATTPCPTGSMDVNGTCRYGSDDKAACATTVLGTSGHIDLGGLLSSVSPGTAAGLDLLFALGGPSKRADDAQYTHGDLDPANGGITVSMYGGGESAPPSNCVPLQNLKLPTGILVPDELTRNSALDWPADMPGPHAGVALSERFANYALGSVFDSGMLCLGLTTDSVAQLNSGLFSLLISSMNTLTYQKKPAPLAITVRPQQPPTLTFGNGSDIATDPTLRVSLPELALDVYVWSTDRFIRAFTAQFDLDVPVNLDVSAAGLTPQLDKIGVTNAKVTNSSLLSEEPEKIAGSLANVISGVAGQLTGGLSKPIDLNAMLSGLGLKLTLPPSVKGKGSPGVRKLTKGSDNYLGLWVSLDLAGSPSRIVSNTEAAIADKAVDPTGLRLATMTKSNAPRLSVRATSSLDDGRNRIEYTYRLDRGAWKPWSEGRFITVDDPFLLMQGKHTLDVSSRVVGQPLSEGEPAHLAFAIDVDAPIVSLGKVEEGRVKVEVADLVSHDDAVEVRFALDDAAFGAWTKAGEVQAIDVGTAYALHVEARDEEGNVASVQQALIRGRADAALAKGSSGCGCSVPGTSSGSSKLGVLATLLGALGIVLRSRGRRSPSPVPSPVGRRTLAKRVAAALAVLTFAGSYAGCSCGSNGSAEVEGTPGGGAGGGGAGGAGGHPPSCQGCTTLEPGLIGEYTSAAVANGGDVWVSGYLEADWDDGHPWGDLVVGKWNASRGAVDWGIIDGVPSDDPPDPSEYDVNGFRGGQTAAGDDVGMWTSIALDAAGNPYVAYYDRTHKSLKLASYDGAKWTTSVIEQMGGSDIGRYAKIAFLPTGKPVVAYLVIERGAAGFATSKVRLARARIEAPAAPGDWAYEDVAVNEQTPCRAWLCKTGEACDKGSMQCMKTATSCSPKCTSGMACINDVSSVASPSCRDVVEGSKLDTYPEASGDYISLAVTSSGGLGLAYYDRIHGNLYLAHEEGGRWSTQLLDGEAQAGSPPAKVDTGDVGIGANLFIDVKGDFHISYVDGTKESLKYMFVKGGTAPSPAETIDDGMSVGGTAFDDGKHIIGDDSNLFVTQSGEIRVSYQDATSGTLRYAVGTPKGGGSHAWTLRAIEQDGFAGAFSRQLVVDAGTQIVNFWRKGGQSVVGDVRLVSP